MRRRLCKPSLLSILVSYITAAEQFSSLLSISREYLEAHIATDLNLHTDTIESCNTQSTSTRTALQPSIKDIDLHFYANWQL